MKVLFIIYLCSIGFSALGTILGYLSTVAKIKELDLHRPKPLPSSTRLINKLRLIIFTLIPLWNIVTSLGQWGLFLSDDFCTKIVLQAWHKMYPNYEKMGVE